MQAEKKWHMLTKEKSFIGDWIEFYRKFKL